MKVHPGKTPKTLLQAMVLGAAVLAAGCGDKPAPAVESARPVRSIVAIESSGAVASTYAGQVHARYESRLGFQTGGKIVARLVEVGSSVKRGQPLMRLDPAQENLQVVAAVAEVEGARSRVDESRVELQRTEALLARQFASQAEVDKQRLTLAEAESQLKSAHARHQIKQNQRGYTDVVADRDGVVTAISAEVGQVVMSGQQVVTVAAHGEREVLVSVPESRVHELKRARALQVSIWAQPSRRYRGVLREMAPDADNVTRTYSARITVADADETLMLGMTASVHATDAEAPRAIRLPLSAIHHQEKQAGVWIVDSASQRVSLRPVQLGAAQDDSVLIASGLSGGETVVTAGVHMLHAGQMVKLAAPQELAKGAAP